MNEVAKLLNLENKDQTTLRDEILEQKNLHLSPLGERLILRAYPDGSKLPFDQRGLHPVIQTRLQGEAIKVLESRKNQSHNRVASIASSGNMPDWWVDKLLPAEVYTKEVEDILAYLAANSETIKRTPRFIDTPLQVEKAKQAIRTHVLQIVEGLEAQGAQQLTFSVCSAAAGFDMMLVSVLKELIEDRQKDITILITLPFDVASVQSYSIPVGLQQETYKKTFQWLLDNDATSKENGRVLFSTPKVIPYFKEDAELEVPNVNQIHARSTLINGDANQTYIDVNNEIFRQALELSGPQGLSVMTFDQGKFSQDLLGGARHMLAMAQRAGIPMATSESKRIMVIQDGIITPTPYTPEIYQELAAQYGPTLDQVEMTAIQLEAALHELKIKI